MKIEFLKDQCCGCYACVNACHSNALYMKENKEGFFYPVVNNQLCIKCGKCDNSCPVLNQRIVSTIHNDVNVSSPIAYAAVCGISDIREHSSSGGAFSVLSSKIISLGGVVYGAAFDENWNVYHCCVNNSNDLWKLRGSKYVQSRIGFVYREIKAYLDLGRIVLFSGTPCQCEGLLEYLHRDYDNLYLVDFICHGVPSPLVWHNYVQYIKGLNSNKKISRIFFRSKKKSWEQFALSFIFDDFSEYQNDLNSDEYLRGFLNDLYLRRSCHKCICRKLNRRSDITIADFWGIQNVLPIMYDGLGTSLILVQSPKGKTLLENVEITLSEVNFWDAIENNSAYLKSPAINYKRNIFFKRFYTGELAVHIIHDLLRDPILQRIRKRIGSKKIIRCMYNYIQRHLC